MPADARPDAPLYRERLRVPWWAWLAGLVAAACSATELAWARPGCSGREPYAVFVVADGPRAVAWLWPDPGTTVTRDGELRVDDARLPVARSLRSRWSTRPGGGRCSVWARTRSRS